MFFAVAGLISGIYLFELLICVVQAYVFVLLVTVYTGEWVAKV